MKVKTSGKEKAVELRLSGWSLKSIAKEIGVSKSSVSLWVNNVKFTLITSYSFDLPSSSSKDGCSSNNRRGCNSRRQNLENYVPYFHAEGYLRFQRNKKMYLEHRYIMEKYLNRELTEDEIVHHINGDKTDNRIENLEVTNHSKHSKFHLKNKFSTKILIKCNFCKKIKIMDYPKYKYKIGKGQDKFYCSKSCAAKDNVFKHTKNSGCFKYNDEIDEIIETAHLEGLSGYQISKKYNLNKQTVYSHMHDLGLDLKVTDEIKKNRSEIKNIIEIELSNGLRPSEIIKKYNINESTFYRYYKKIKNR